MSSASGEHEDQYGVVLEPIAAVLTGAEEAVERLHATWDAGLREAMTQLDQIVAKVDEATRLTRVLVAGQRRSAT